MPAWCRSGVGRAPEGGGGGVYYQVIIETRISPGAISQKLVLITNYPVYKDNVS